MSEARWLVGDVFDRLAELPDQSVHSVITSPPYWRKRRYLPLDHPDAAKEIGQEPSPGAFLATLLRVTDELWRIVRDDGTIWFNLGDTASGSGGAGGDYLDGGQREGQNAYVGTARAIRDAGNTYASAARQDLRSAGREKTLGNRTCDDTPLRKSVCWIPEPFGASLAYGRNLLTGEPCRQWITRPQITWCKPAPTPGEIIDKFREATELIVWASKQPRYYFDLDAVREPHKVESRKMGRTPSRAYGMDNSAGSDAKPENLTRARALNAIGAPPLTWWKVNTSGYEGAHFATFPPELIVKPVIVSCPPGGTILDPFGGSGTTASVATGNGRNCISIDLDSRNLDLARERIGMFLYEPEETPA